MINAKLTKPQVSPITTEDRLFKLLESIDWKLWEMMNMMKAQVEPPPPKAKSTRPSLKNSEE